MAKKILIIDDEVELVKAVEVRLKASGHEIEVAYDGPSGMDKAKEIKPDLILLDIVMPLLNGYSVAKKLMTEQETRDIPIIIFTASQQRDLEARCQELGIANFIMKPFETSELLAMVNGILNEK